MHPYPPSPGVTIPPTDLEYFESKGEFLGQPKYEGARNTVRIKDGNVTLQGRHGAGHLAYTLSVTMKNEILALPGLEKGLEYLLDSELMIKTTAKETKEKIIFFDILQLGKYLFMKPDQESRIKLLDEVCGYPRELDPWRQMAYQISDNLLMAPTFDSGFLNFFNEDKGDEVEGIVLRKRNSTLDNFGAKPYKARWLIRCRKRNRKSDF